jgi:hypothetical protein
MLNEMKLLKGPKVTLDQIRWPKAAEFNKDNIKNIVFDMEVIKHRVDNFGVRGMAGPGGHVDLHADFFQPGKRDIVVDHIMPLHQLWDNWRLNQQLGRGLRDRDHNQLAIKACNFFDARPRANFEGVVMRPDIGPLDAAPIKLKMPKVRSMVVGAGGGFRMVDFENVPIVKFDADQPGPLKAKKPNPLKALKAHWENAQKPKPGIGYGHPALKGLIHGRNRREFPPLVLSWREPVRMRGGIGFGGLRGLLDGFNHNQFFVGDRFEPWQAVIKPQLNTEQREARRIELLEIEKQEAEREAKREAENKAYRYERTRVKRQFTDNAGSYVRIALKQLNEPGANVCQLLANMWAIIKRHRYAGDDVRNLLFAGLKDLGFTILGNGHFSCAFKGPDGHVYKVNANHKDSDGWYAYAVNTMHFGGGLKCVPKIDAIAYRDKTYCVKMDELIPLSRAEFEPFEELNNAFRIGGDPEKVARLLGISHRDAETMCYIIRATKAETPGSRLDIHYQNVMYRRDKHGNLKLVLTDPLAYGDFEMAFYDKRLTSTGIVPRPDANQLALAA